jgi:hypothetical protein
MNLLYRGLTAAQKLSVPDFEYILIQGFLNSVRASSRVNFNWYIWHEQILIF